MLMTSFLMFVSISVIRKQVISITTMLYHSMMFYKFLMVFELDFKTDFIFLFIKI